MIFFYIFVKPIIPTINLHSFINSKIKSYLYLNYNIQIILETINRLEFESETYNIIDNNYILKFCIYSINILKVIAVYKIITMEKPLI